MRKKKNQVDRMINMLKNDRSQSTDNFNKLLNIDLSKLLTEYFSELRNLKINVSKNGEKLTVNVDFEANGIKDFISVPDVNLI